MLTFLAQNANKIKLVVNQNSTTILTGVGVVGTVATAYLTGRATFKAADIIGRQKNALILAANLEMESDDIPKLTKIDQFKLVWPHYILPTGAGLVTITSIIAAHKVSAGRLAAMTAAAGVSERALQQYKEKVIERLGERQDQKIRDEIAQDQVNANPVNSQVFISGTGQVLCFDTLTGRYFNSSVEEIKRAENRINFELNQFGYASLSMFFDEVGLQPTDFTDSVGWSSDGMLEVRLSTVMSTDNRPCIAVGFSRNPRPDYQKYWMT